MKLRFATQADLAQLIQLGRLAHAESRFVKHPYDEARLSQNIQGLIAAQEGRHCFLLAENREGEIVGGLVGSLERYFFTNVQSARSLLLWVHPHYRGSPAAVRLVAAFRDWGEKCGAVEICMDVASGVTPARTDRFLRKFGFVQTGGNYVMGLSV